MQSFIRSNSRLRIIGIIVTLFAALSFGTVSIADVFSGLSTHAVSQDVQVTRLTLTKPADSAIGDVLIATIAVNGGISAGVTVPEGWNLISRINNDADTESLLSYWKVVNAVGAEEYTWQIEPQARAAGGITRYSGVDTGSPILTSAGQFGRGTVATAPAIATSVPNAQILAVYSINAGSNNAQSFSVPTGMTVKFTEKNTPFGPTIGVYDALQTAAGTVSPAESTVSTGIQREWVAQHIALKPKPTGTSDDFEEYANGTLAGNNGGTNWTTPWTGNSLYQVQDQVAKSGLKSMKAEIVTHFEGDIRRTFAPKTSGTLHFAARKDSGDHSLNFSVFSGNQSVFFISIGSDTQGGRNWTMQNGTDQYIVVQPYTLASFDTIDVEFDTITDQFRISINNGPFTPWRGFQADVSSVDTIAINGSSSGQNSSSLSDLYWDDIRFGN